MKHQAEQEMIVDSTNARFSWQMRTRPWCKVVAVLGTLTFTAVAHEGHVDKDAQLACKEKKLRASCQYVKETGDNVAKVYSGFCQKISSNKMCVRNQPIKTIVLGPLEN
ncbi:MAG: hypothetical protein ACW7DQ_04215 [Paraglaciecola chathamensis]|jgi:hypothetical protein